MFFVAKAMAALHADGKDNLIYHAVRCPGERRQGLPMVLGCHWIDCLVAHNLKFFTSDVANPQAPDDYKSWCQSMYTLFGNKWTSMHLSPMWSSEVNENVPVTPDGNESCYSLNIISQALHETFRDECWRLLASVGECQGCCR